MLSFYFRREKTTRTNLFSIESNLCKTGYYKTNSILEFISNKSVEQMQNYVID